MEEKRKNLEDRNSLSGLNEIESLLDIDSPEKREEYEHIWDLSQEIIAPDFDTERALNDLHAQIPVKEKKSFSFTWRQIAAILVLGLVLGISIPKIIQHINGPDFIRITAKAGDRIEVELENGLYVYLNSNSELKYPKNSLSRELELKGEAYFEIRDESMDPLLVKTGSTSFLCMEGSFNIKARSPEELVEVGVEKGWVAISNTNMSDEQENIVAEGERGFVLQNVAMTNEDFQNKNFMAWKTGELIFDDCPMYEVAEVLSDYFQKPIEIVGDIKYRKFTSQFSNPDVKQIIREMEASFDMKMEQSGGKLILSGNAI